MLPFNFLKCNSAHPCEVIAPSCFTKLNPLAHPQTLIFLSFSFVLLRWNFKMGAQAKLTERVHKWSTRQTFFSKCIQFLSTQMPLFVVSGLYVTTHMCKQHDCLFLLNNWTTKRKTFITSKIAIFFFSTYLVSASHGTLARTSEKTHLQIKLSSNPIF